MIQSLQSGGGLFFTFEQAEETPEGEARFDVLKNRNPRSFSTATRSLLELITIQEGEIKPVGSQKYTVARYPGDIDLMEKVEYCCSMNTATNKIAKEIIKIAKGIKATPNCYLGDFKAGLDFRYTKLQDYLGDIDSSGEIKGYKYALLKKEIIKLRNAKLITNSDFKIINDLIRKNLSISKWTILYKFCRKFWIIRWSINELIVGKKQVGMKVAKKFTINLSKALTHKTICKLDLWAPVNGRFIEITNFFITSYMDTKGDIHPISPTLSMYIERIITDIKHYGDKTLESYNPLKMAKRLFAIAASDTVQDRKTLTKLYPLFSSGSSILYQINAEIETIIDILSDSSIENEFDKDASMDIIIRQIEGFKSRMSQIYDLDIYEEVVYSIIDDIVASDVKYYIIKKLEHLSREITANFTEGAENYLKKGGLNNVNFYDYLLDKP